jgi:hypothetical protein
MQFSLPGDRPDLICLEVSGSSGSLPPHAANSHSMTLFGDGFLHTIEVKGYLPAYTTILSTGEVVRGLDQWPDTSALNRAVQHLGLRDGRVCLTSHSSLGELVFSWMQEDGSVGRAVVRRVCIKPDTLAPILAQIYPGIIALPEQIGELATGCHTLDLRFCCQRNGVLFQKDISWLSYDCDPVQTAQFHALNNQIYEALVTLSQNTPLAGERANFAVAPKPWWRFW